MWLLFVHLPVGRDGRGEVTLPNSLPDFIYNEEANEKI